MNIVNKIWNGELPLVKAYWLYGVAVGFFTTLLFLLLKDYPTTLTVLSVVFVPYQILITVGIWRSANNYIIILEIVG